MAKHSSILTWRIPWTEEPGGLQSIGPQRDMTEVTEHICPRTEKYGEGESVDTSWSPKKKECSSFVGSSLQLNQSPESFS